MSKFQNSQKGGSYTFPKLTLFTSMLAILLGIVMGVFSMPAFAVDANGAFELDDTFGRGSVHRAINKLIITESNSGQRVRLS